MTRDVGIFTDFGFRAVSASIRSIDLGKQSARVDLL